MGTAPKSLDSIDTNVVMGGALWSSRLSLWSSVEVDLEGKSRKSQEIIPEIRGPVC